MIFETRRISWHSGHWLNPPAAVQTEGSDLVVTAVGGSDFWRTTSYGFVRDSGHALLADFPDGSAVDVGFHAD